MNLQRREPIMPGVTLTWIQTDKYRTGRAGVHLLCPLTRATAAKDALLPPVLRRGTVGHRDAAAIGRRLGELYGARIDPVVEKRGDLHDLGFTAEFADDDYTGGGRVLEGVVSLLGELLLRPDTRNGKLSAEWTGGETVNLTREIRGVLNDKGAYALQRLGEVMAPGEGWGVPNKGLESTLRRVTATGLTRHYRALTAAAPVELFYCGSAPWDRVRDAFLSALSDLPRAGAPVLPETEPGVQPDRGLRKKTEELDLAQSRVALGLRLGKLATPQETAAAVVANALFGGALQSRLFSVVREKLSLCYEIWSELDRVKGIVTVSAGTDGAETLTVLSRSLAELASLQKGDFSPAELTAVKNETVAALRLLGDRPRALEDFWLDNAMTGAAYSPEELAGLCDAVTAEETAAMARRMLPDTAYLLTGKAVDHADD